MTEDETVWADAEVRKLATDWQAETERIAAENTHLRYALAELISAVSQVQHVWRLGSLNDVAVALIAASVATDAAEQALKLGKRS